MTAAATQSGAPLPHNWSDQALRDLGESLHDIRNHLNAILGLVSMLLLQSRDEATARLRPMIEEQSAQLHHLVDQLVKPDAQKASMKSRAVMPARFLGAMVDLYSPFAAEYGVRLAWHDEPGLPALDVDGALLHRLLTNLLVNAIKHSQASQVAVRAELLNRTSPQSGLRLSVVDDGVGIHPDALKPLAALLNGARPLVPEYDRCGIGIVARMARELGAIVELASEPGEGTTATVLLPTRNRFA